MVKDEEVDEDTVAKVGTFEIKAEVVADQIKSVLMFIGGGVLAYVAADTVRKVMIEHAKK
jgi:hypothetical protein